MGYALPGTPLEVDINQKTSSMAKRVAHGQAWYTYKYCMVLDL